MRIKGTEYQGNFEIGSRVHCILYGGRDGIIFKIAGEQSPETIQHFGGGIMVMGGTAHVDVVFENGTISRGIPEGIIRGVQWYILESQANQAEIQHALAYAELETSRKDKEQKTKEEAKKDCRQAFRDAHPELVPVDPKTYDSLKKGSRNIKIELKDIFPETKFSVRSQSYSGGCSIRINWTDGPTTEAIEKITNKYQEGNFNGMEDIYERNQNNVWPDVFGGAKYVTCDRDSSKEAYLQAVAEVEEEYGIKLIVSYTSCGSPYVNNDFDVSIENGGRYWSGSQIINRRISETDYRKEA